MIAIAIVTGVLGVWQTLLSNQVGQRVMHDLRTAVFRHLQRLSLAFFTRTRTGEVQSRISNDIGGVQSVVTSTATSIVSNATTVLATMVGMIALSWELSLFAFALIPVFVLLTRRVGDERRKIAKSTQETLADISSLVQESLSVSGILLGKTMGRTDELADRFEGESRLLADLEVRQRMAGRWMMAIDPDDVRGHARRRVLVRRARARARLDTRSRCRRSSRSRRCRRGSSSRSGRCSASGSTCRRRSRSSTGSSSTSTSRSTSRSARSATTLDAAGDVVVRRRVVPLRRRRVDARGRLVHRAGGTKTALVGETGSGKTTLGYLAARLYDVDAGRVSIDGVDVRDLTFASLASLVGVVSQETYLFHA